MAASGGGGEAEEEVRIVLLCPASEQTNDGNSDNVRDFTVGESETTQIFVPISSESASTPSSTSTLVEVDKESPLIVSDDDRHQVSVAIDDVVGSLQRQTRLVTADGRFLLEPDTEDIRGERNVPVVVINCEVSDDIRPLDCVVVSEEVEDEGDEEQPTMTTTSPVNDYMVKKVLLPKRYNPSSVTESPSTSNLETGNVGRFSSSSDDSSVLRTLLQASRKQLMLYQAHKHKSERIQFLEGSGASGSKNGSESDQFRSGSHHHQRRLRPQSRRKRPSPITTKQIIRYSVASQTFPAGIHDLVDNSDSRCVEVERERRPEETSTSSEVVDTSGTSLLSRQINSQIKALLLGQDYVRDERTTVQCRRVDKEEHEEQNKVEDEDEAEESRIEDPLVKRQRLTEESILPVIISNAMKVVAEFNDLSFSVQHGHRSVFLEVRRKGLYGIPSPGMVPAQVVIDDEGACWFLSVVGTTEEVRCSKSESGEMSFDELRPLLQKLSIRGGHVFCPGVEQDLVDAAPNTKNMTCVGPFSQRRYQSKDCSVWYMLTPSQSWLPLNEGVHKCKTCKHLERYLRSLKKAKEKRDTENVSLDVANSDFMCVWGSTDVVET